MKPISNKVHGVLDYVTVAAFALIPTVFSLSGLPAYLSYTLSVIHLLMTLLTDFEFGLLKLVPIKAHKIVESIVGPVLVVVPWVLGFSEDMSARWVFVAAGVVIIAVGLLSQYSKPTSTT